jgi:hypothetical protein
MLCGPALTNFRLFLVTLTLNLSARGVTKVLRTTLDLKTKRTQNIGHEVLNFDTRGSALVTNSFSTRGIRGVPLDVFSMKLYTNGIDSQPAEVLQPINLEANLQVPRVFASHLKQQREQRGNKGQEHPNNQPNACNTKWNEV